MQIRLTKRTVDSAKCGTRDVFLWDADLKGFGLKITPKDRRVFIAQYWAPNLHLVRRRITIGVFGTLTVEQARTYASRLLGRVANGEDPAAEASHGRRTAKEAIVAILSVEYLDEVRAKMKSRTADEYTRLFKVYIGPAIGKKPVAHLTVRDI